jgi:cell division septum initiation protein DivIVA
MAASVLNSPRAVEMSILVVRAFVRFRQILATNRQLATKLDELDHKIAAHDKSIADHGKSIAAHRKGIVSLYAAIENLMPTLTDRQIGFKGKGADKNASKATDKPKSAPTVRP